MIEAVAAEPHFLIRYQCSPYHVDSALYPAVQHLTHAAGVAEGDTPDERLARLEALLARAAADFGTGAYSGRLSALAAPVSAVVVICSPFVVD